MSTPWAGWAYDETALYLAEIDDPERVGLWLQVEDERYLLARFVDPVAANAAQNWISVAFSRTADALRALVSNG